MTEKSTEDRIKSLEVICKEQKMMIERLEAVHAIQNIMGRYAFLLTGRQYDEIVNLFAQNTPGVTGEIGRRGVYEGVDGIRRLYPKIHTTGMGAPVGNLMEHQLTTPIIEVAGDGKTAKAVWLSPGIVTRPDKTGKVQAFWLWGKYGADFVKEDGEWKIWHLHAYMTFMCPFERSWAEGESVFGGPSTEYPPDRPTSYHKPYDPKSVYEIAPMPPKSYETYDE